ncbi:MAG: hypothetical protein O3A20_04485, partial [Planctomycetota bacterium]|nr:hypothetical protein [Planctomycetota bacterium]
GDVRLVRLQVPDGFPPTPLSAMRAPVFAIVGAVLRGGEVLIPHGNDKVQGGDHLLVFCRADGLEETRAFFARPPTPEV